VTAADTPTVRAIWTGWGIGFSSFSRRLLDNVSTQPSTGWSTGCRVSNTRVTPVFAGMT